MDAATNIELSMSERAADGADRRAGSRARAAAAALAVVYLIAAFLYLISRGSWPTPDFLIAPLLLASVLAGRGWRFLIDWTPFLVLVLVYEAFRGMADDLQGNVHVQELIDADRWLLGAARTAPEILQDRFLQARVTLYDWLATLLYMAHFVAPVMMAFLLWLGSRRVYWRFITAVLALFFAGFVTYYLYPAAPPWLASGDGLIQPIERVHIRTLASLPETESLSLAFQHFSPNHVAAMPSLHAAAPLLLALISLHLWRWRGLPVLVYAIVGGVTWMYMGEHYLVDILAGWVYAIVVFVAVWLLLPRYIGRLSLARLTPPARLLPRRALPDWPLAAFACAMIVLVWIEPLRQRFWSFF